MGETGSGFPEKLNYEQIRKCSARRATSKPCTLHIDGNEYSPRYLYWGYFMKLLKRKIVLEGRLQTVKERSATATCLVCPIHQG